MNKSHMANAKTPESETATVPERQMELGSWTSVEYSDGITEITRCTGEAVAWIEPGKSQSKAERRAIARLIVAAPELLAACKAFEGYYCGAPDSPTRGMAHAFEIVKAAIAKAVK